MLQLVIISMFLLLYLFARLSSLIPEVDFYILFSLHPTCVAFLALFSLLPGIHRGFFSVGEVFVHTLRIYEISLKVQVGSGTRFSGKQFIYFFLLCVCFFFSGLFD